MSADIAPDVDACPHRKIVESKRWPDGSVDGRCVDCGEDAFPIRLGFPGSAGLTPAERLVDQVLAEQRAKGRATYGKGLDHTEPRDWNRMAIEELVDAVQYLAAENARLHASDLRARSWISEIAMWFDSMPPDDAWGDDIWTGIKADFESGAVGYVELCDTTHRPVTEQETTDAG